MDVVKYNILMHVKNVDKQNEKGIFEIVLYEFH